MCAPFEVILNGQQMETKTRTNNGRSDQNPTKHTPTHIHEQFDRRCCHHREFLSIKIQCEYSSNTNKNKVMSSEI